MTLWFRLRNQQIRKSSDIADVVKDVHQQIDALVTSALSRLNDEN